MQCGDLEWFYCKEGEILNANEAMEKRLIIYKKIGRELKIAHNLAQKTWQYEDSSSINQNRSKGCSSNRLDEFIYYKCEGSAPSVEVALNNPWVKYIEDFGITSAKGVSRTIDTFIELGILPPALEGMNYVLKSRLSRKPRIIQENIEAIYLLRFVYDPYENITEVVNIIIDTIINNMSPSRKQKLSDYINAITNVSNLGNTVSFQDRFDVRPQVNSSVRNFATDVGVDIMADSKIRKFIVSAIITQMVAGIITNYPSFFKPFRPTQIIKRTTLVATLMYAYGTIEKMSEAAKRLENKNKVVYDVMNKSKITMAYYFVEEELGSLITLAASPSSVASDDAFISEVRHLINKYKN
ncbi:hypothetical protein G9394_16315 [Proteus vulgaris]|nr:hypothetical protein G9394_16315 [Proteus vulgaris]